MGCRGCEEGGRKSYVQSADDVWLGAVGDRCHVSYMVQNKERGREGRRKRRRGTHSLQLRDTHLSLYCSGGAGAVACCVLQDMGLIYCQSERANLGGQSQSQNEQTWSNESPKIIC